jgi:CHRD domain
MKYRTFGFAFLSFAVVAAAPVLADDRDDNRFSASLRPAEEVPSVSSAARGTFSLRIRDNDTRLVFNLTYEGLEGDVQQAHIHFGDKDVNGGISIWLCSNLPNPPSATPPGTQPCPQAATQSAPVTGTILAANVVGPAGQGIDAGQLAEIVRAIRRGLAYANVHSARFPGGEVRGQIVESDDHDRDHD